MLLGKAGFVCFLVEKKKKKKKKVSIFCNIGTDALAAFTGSIVKWPYNITTTIR